MEMSRAAVEEVPAASVQFALFGNCSGDEPVDRCGGRVALRLHLN
jgi:hypothetical protein